MTEKEKIESYIANCKCCLLAEAMKECPLCLFKIGLTHHEEPVGGPIPVVIPQRIELFAVAA